MLTLPSGARMFVYHVQIRALRTGLGLRPRTQSTPSQTLTPQPTTAVRSGSAGIPSWRHRVGFRLKWRDSAGLGGEGGCSGGELSRAEWGWVLATVGNDLDELTQALRLLRNGFKEISNVGETIFGANETGTSDEPRDDSPHPVIVLVRVPLWLFQPQGDINAIPYARCRSAG